MMKKILFTLLVIISTISIDAQIQHAGLPIGRTVNSLKNTSVSSQSVITMPAIDTTSHFLSQNDTLHKALRFAYPFSVELTPENCGEWQVNEDGSRLWQLTIASNEAYSINIIFDKFKLPTGGKVFIYNSDLSHIIGAFTEENNKASGVLPTLPVIGSEITVEYQEPLNPEFSAELQIGKVNHDYTGISNMLKTGYFGDSESCEKDVSCYTDQLYLDTRRSTVKLIIDGSELMTGTLINNTAEDGTPYIITASHGYRNADYDASTTIFIFNHQVPMCYTDVEGTREQAVAGGTMRAYSPDVNGEALDFALVEMSVAAPAAYLPYYAGWNISSTSPTSSFCIHHPQGDVKKISFDNDALLKRSLIADGVTYMSDAHWNVQEWDVGVTEGGSSGSGLFNPEGELIGALSAGAAYCSSPKNDYFYRLDLAWEASDEDDRQLAVWLDPSNTGAQQLDNYEASDVKATERVSHVSDSSNITIVDDTSTGNIAGNNYIGITHFVEKFENSTSKNILGVYFIASEGKSSSVVNISVWTGDEKPVNEVYNEDLVIKNWTYNNTTDSGTTGGHSTKRSLEMQENFYIFSTPITVNENYFIGFEVDNDMQNNPFGLVLSNTNSGDNAFYYDTEWHSYLDLADYNKATTLWIDPVVQNLGDTSSSLTSTTPIKIYPNPVKNGESLTIYASEEELGDITIYDVLGKKHHVTTVSQNANQCILNIDNLPQGVFIVNTGLHQLLLQKL